MFLSNSQLKLFGYNDIFLNLSNLFNNNRLPNKILLSGIKGIGKASLAYHLINYIFSINETNKYDLKNFTINENNKSFILVQKNIHPNFFKIELNEKKNIEISQIRQMITFSNKSSFDNNYKIVLIDSIDYLNINSVNALLKILEEPNSNIFFILIYSFQKPIFDTIKSRCINFKINLSEKYIKEIVNNFFSNEIFSKVPDEFKSFYASPLNIIRYINFCNEHNFNVEEFNIENLLNYIIDKKIYTKSADIKDDIKFYIEIYFRIKILKFNDINIHNLYNKYNKSFDLAKRFNLDFESLFIDFNSSVLNER